MTAALEQFSLAGRVAVVAGASRGIGAAIARGLADAGAQVVGLGRSERGEGDYRVCDVTDADSVRAVFAAIDQRYGRLDVLVNSAGHSLPAGTPTADAHAEFRRILSVNLGGTFNCCIAAEPIMRRGGGGSIINVTSINSVRGFPGNPGYVASKGGLAALTRALAVDWGPAQIRVNALAPGYVRTAMTAASWNDSRERDRRARHTALGRWGEPDDLIGAAIFLASSASKYVTGQEIFVDGGWTAKGMSDLG